MLGRLLRVTGTVLVIAVAFVTPVLATSAPVSAATTPAQLNSEVSGTFSGTSALSAGCSGQPGQAVVVQTFDATYTTSTGTGSISMNGCTTIVSFTPAGASFSGSFTLTAPDGATLQGTATGPEAGNLSNVSLTLAITLTATSGTNEFANVTGVIDLTGPWQSQAGQGPVSGSLSGALNPGSGTPTTSSLSSSSNPSALGQPVTFTDTVSPAPTGGTVAFSEDGSPISGCTAVPVSGASASCSVTPATADNHYIVAVYGGSGAFLGSMAIYGQDVVAPPTTSVAIPSNDATVSGDSWLDAGASSTVGIASVNFELSGGSLSDKVISGSTPTPYGYIGGWNSTSVPNGTYTLQSVATDVDGFSTTSAPITITVNNPPPSTSVLVPSNGATQSGTEVLDAGATADVTGVSFELSGGSLTNQVISASGLTPYGWIGEWNSASVPNGTYTLQSVGTYSGGTVTSVPITITASN